MDQQNAVEYISIKQCSVNHFTGTLHILIIIISLFIITIAIVVVVVVFVVVVVVVVVVVIVVSCQCYFYSIYTILGDIKDFVLIHFKYSIINLSHIKLNFIILLSATQTMSI